MSGDERGGDGALVESRARWTILERGGAPCPGVGKWKLESRSPQPISGVEVDYPLIREAHAATSLPSGEAAGA